jgi:2,4-dienoyl-CoA reductase (NADPH2)
MVERHLLMFRWYVEYRQARSTGGWHAGPKPSPDAVRRAQRWTWGLAVGATPSYRRDVTDMAPRPAPSLNGPVALGPVMVPNRVFFCPTSVGYANEGVVTPAMLDHYRRRAIGGAGAVMTEHLAVSEEGWQHRRQPAAWNSPEFVHGLRDLAAAIRAHGTVAIAQISHAGRYAGPWDEWEARRRLAPSPVPFPLLNRTVVPQEITRTEIDGVIAAFACTVRMLMDLGWQGVEIHGGSGFLISGFLSPRMNTRCDRYGGSPRARVRFAAEVVYACREAANESGCVGMHLLTDELVDGGLRPHEMAEMVPILEEAGVDFLRPNVGTFETLRLPSNAGLMSTHDCNRSSTDALLEVATVPVIANGGLRSRADVNDALGRGVAAVALARPMLADPDWMAKIQADADAEVRACPCQPPTCLQTQLRGAVCSAWPQDTQSVGHSGNLARWNPSIPGQSRTPKVH